MNPAVYEAAEKLVTKWLRDLPSGNSLHVSLHFLIRFFMFHLLLRQCLWVFSMFPKSFSLFPTLGLTLVKLVHWTLPNCFSFYWLCVNYRWNVFTEICSVSQRRFHGARWRREFMQRNCSVYDCLLEKVSPYCRKVPFWNKNHWWMV